MARTVSIIGLQNDELYWVRRLLALLRHPDPAMAELARQAMIYLSEAAQKRESTAPGPALDDPVIPASTLVNTR